MNLRPSTLDRIAGSFAEAVASGDYEAAEGWMAAAGYVERREADLHPAPAGKPQRLNRLRGSR